MAKKPTWSQLKQVINQCHGNIMDIAKACDVTRRTVYNWMRKDKGKFQKAIEESRGALLDLAESNLAKKIEESNLTAIIFYLKCLGKDRGYIEKQDHEVSGEIHISIEEHTIESKEDLPDDNPA